jgi:hypothetical protein
MRKIACQRLAVLIDADNIEIGARKGFNRPVNYDALFAAINGREVVRALYFKPRECSPGRRAFLERKLIYPRQSRGSVYEPPKAV